jgi:MFS family permease
MASTIESRPPFYRWVIEGLILAMLIVQVMTWLAPAPILEPMIKGVGITLGQAGLIISVIALCIAIFSFAGTFVSARLGTLRTLLVGIWLMGIAEVFSGYTTSFPSLLMCRVVEGVGYGLIIGPPAALVMQWFAAREWPWMNMVNSVCAYIGIAIVYALTPHVYTAFGSSWGKVLTSYGIAAVIVSILWTALGRERQVATETGGGHGSGGTAKLSEVTRIHGVPLMAIALFGAMWVFQLYTAFLPQYFRVERGLDLAAAANLTAVLPLTAMFAAAAGGIGTAVIGLRRPFLWPTAICTLIGCAGAILLPSVNGIRLSLMLVGIGAAGGLAATGTLMMELPEMTPARMGTAFSFVWAAGYGGAFISPFLGGAIAPLIGLRTVMLVFLSFQVLPIVALYLLPETGPAAKTIGLVAAQQAG